MRSIVVIWVGMVLKALILGGLGNSVLCIGEERMRGQCKLLICPTSSWGLPGIGNLSMDHETQKRRGGESERRGKRRKMGVKVRTLLMNLRKYDMNGWFIANAGDVRFSGRREDEC